MNSHNFGNLFTPDYSHLTGLLNHLNAEELKSILNSDEKANEIINDLKQVKDIEAEREMILARNKSISEYNLTQKSVIDQYHEDLISSYGRAVELKDKLLAIKSDIENKPVAQSKDTLLALLQAATSEIEEEAEATVDAFMKNDLSVEDFLEKYLELRKLAHLRRIKSEKMVSMIQTDGNDAAVPVKPQRLRKPPAPPVPNPSPHPYPNVLPYPINSSPVNQNIPVVPSRPAPQPPPVSAQNFPYPNSSYPSPFTYYSPYPVPQISNYPPQRKS